MAFVRWNQTTNIWELAAAPENPSTPWNHLPIADPTQPLDTANKQYVDSKVSGGPFVPYNGANATVNLNTQVVFAGRAVIGGGGDVGYPLTVHAIGQQGDLGLHAFSNSVHYNAVNFNNTAVQTSHVFYTRNGTGVDNTSLTINATGISVNGSIFSTGPIFERGRGIALGSWQSWTPQWKSFTVADGVFGNSTVTARYSVVGKTVYYTIQINFGSTVVFPASYWAFTVPAGLPINGTSITGSAVMRKSDGTTVMAAVIPASYYLGINDAIALISSNASTPAEVFVYYIYPWNFAAGDSVWINGFYETP